jgi:hypothetical protein
MQLVQLRAEKITGFLKVADATLGEYPAKHGVYVQGLAQFCCCGCIFAFYRPSFLRHKLCFASGS